MMQNQTPRPSDILILGIGNPLMGDDGAGIRAAEMLDSGPLPAHVHVKTAGLPGWGLVNWFANYPNVILIDAVDMEEPPGTWHCFRPEDVRFVIENGTLSLHHPGLAAGLALAEALEMLPETLTLYGIQPANLTPGAELSPKVKDSLQQVVASLLNEINHEPEKNPSC